MNLKHNYDLGIFLIRLALGLVFIIHGWNNWQHLDGSTWSYVSSTIELLGGIAMLFGFWHRLAGWLLAVVMLGTIIWFTGKMGFVGGYEFQLTLLLCSAAMAMLSPGKYIILGKKS